MALDTTPYEFHEHPKTAVRFVVLFSLAVIVFALATALPWPATHHTSTVRGVSDPCGEPTCLAPRQLIAARTARHMKRELGNHALLVDIRDAAEAPAGLAIGSDVDVPFMEPLPAAKDAQMVFRIDFGLNVDEALRAAKMRHDEPVILLSPSTERSVLAALLLQERGYTNVLVVDL